MPTYTAPGVYVEEVPSSQKVLASAPTAVAAFVGFTARAPHDDPSDPQGLAPRLVTSWTQFENLYGGFVEGAVLPLSVHGFFLNGGTAAYIVRVPHVEPAGESSRLALPATDRSLGLPVAVTSVEPDADLTVTVTTDEAPEDLEGPAPFTLRIVENGVEVESFGDLTLGGPRDAATVVNATSTKVKIEILLEEDTDISAQLEVLRPGAYTLEKADPIPVAVTGRRFAGSETARSGINGLSIAEDVTIVVVPDLVTAASRADGTVDLDLWKAVQTSLVAHCENHPNRMALLDPPPGLTPQQVKEWRSEVAQYDSAFAAMYYPWITVENPTGGAGATTVSIPASGHAAGLWARTDDTRGVWKAPANDTLRGVLDVERAITQTEQGFLNPIGINAIRPFGTRGIRVWGARTLASDTDWQYVNVRRLFNMIESTILEGTQWAVFEPNDVKLWEGVNRTLSGYLHGLWKAGALFGSSPQQAYFVKCDETTNTPDSIDAGKLVVEVGIAPVKPAEFVVFRISQNKNSAA